MRELKKETKTKKPAAKKAASKEKEPKKVKETKPKKEIVVKEKKVVEPKVVEHNEPKEEGILNVKEKKYYQVLSRIIYVVTKIVRICLMVCVPFIFLIMILIPFIFKDFEVNANIISFGETNIVVRDNSVSIKIGDDVRVMDCSTREAERILSFLTDNSKAGVILIAELSLLVFGVIAVMTIYLLCFVEKLFNNFANQNTPFTNDNTKHILMIAIILAAIKFIYMFIAFVDLFPVNFSSYSIIEVLSIFVLYFIFKYATGMQKKVDTKIYD